MIDKILQSANTLIIGFKKVVLVLHSYDGWVIVHSW